MTERGKGKYSRYGFLIGLLSGFLLLSGSVRAQHFLSPDEDVFVFNHYSNEQGLPSSYVKGVTQDPYGFIWMATRVAVCRFDGINFKTFPAYDAHGNNFDLRCNEIFNFSDSLLICRTNEGEFFMFDFKKECFFPFLLLNDLGSTQSIEPVEEGFWICRDNQIHFLDIKTGLLSALDEKLRLGNFPSDLSFNMVQVANRQLVALTSTHLLFWIDLDKSIIKSFDLPDSWSDATIVHLYTDSYRNIWLNDESLGLCRIRVDNGDASFYSTDMTGTNRIPHNMVHTFAEDQQGRMWIGSEAGIMLWSQVFERFSFVRYDPTSPTGLNTDPVYSLCCDREGNMWLGTYFGGINFWSGRKKFFRDWHAGIGRWQLGGNVVSCLTEDTNGDLWIGLEDMGLNRLNVKTGEVFKITSESKPSGLSYNNIHDLMFFDPQTLWIATYTGGINILNVETGKMSYINRRTNSGLPSNNIYDFLKTQQGVYIATTNGIAFYNPATGSLKPFRPDKLGGIQFESMTQSRKKIWFSSATAVYCYDENRDSLFLFEPFSSMQNINFVKTDSKNRIWIGDCHNGLCYYDEQSGEIQYFNSSNGFPVSWIFSLEEGDNGWMWASSDNGLVKFNPLTRASIQYNSNSGIPFNQFNYRSSYQDKYGNIYFGGNNGMVSFNEAINPGRKVQQDIVFTGFQLFNKPLLPDSKTSLKESINQLSQLRLKHKENVFTIEFSALSYATGGRCQYAYYLENFEEQWNDVGDRNFATYTNLSPGTYFFHVRVIGNEHNEASNERILKIRILPPFWLSPWALIVYFLAIWGVSIILFMIGKRLEKSKALVVMERREKEHSDEIHKVKLEFFTNISHELKTPLTLIIGPLSKLLEEEKLTPSLRKRLMVIEKNAQRLFQLINQLLEFRKIETGREKLQVSKSDIGLLIMEIKEAFDTIAETREIEFSVSAPQPETLAFFDANKLDKIIYNLLSNAFKFTNKGGKVELSVELAKQRGEKFRKSRQELIISISDSGKGIKPELLDKVFERFFYFEEEHQKYKGSGIGLAYVKSLVILHKGEIQVESEPGKGTCFTVTLPVSISDYEPGDLVSEPDAYNEDERELQIDNDIDKENIIIDALGLSHDPVVLLVEDHAELLEFMKETLEEKYQVFTAKNGNEALIKLKNVMPDLIISDVMMPGMDGYELTKTLKADLNTSHVPVILLTAKSGIDNRYKGLKTGADYYIEKPFYPHILEQNIENILKTRQNLIERFKNDAFVPVSELAHSESDKVFVEKLTGIIKDHISNPDLDVTFLIRELGMSRSLLHLKLKSLADCSTTEFIRSVRLKEAIKLISSGKCNISEAAYETGFSSPTYFTRRFKEYFGKSPREYFNM